MSKSKLNKTKNYKGPTSAEDEPMNENMVKLILQAAGFSSPEEVRKIAEKEQNKALNKSVINYDAPAWIKRVDKQEKQLPC